jgi:hypothetical protein
VLADEQPFKALRARELRQRFVEAALVRIQLRKSDVGRSEFRICRFGGS